MTAPSIVILGGGVMGASTAYHLAARGARDILMIDRADGPGGGSTSRATGGFRAQYATAINVRLSLLARQKLVGFRDEIGGVCGYEQAGYLWLASSAREMAILAEARAVQHAEGLHEAVEVSIADIARLNPAVALDGVVGGSFCPTDGFIHPLGILEGYLSASARLGVRIEWGVEAVGLERDPSGRVTAVVTRTGRIPTSAVVNAAGAWAGDFACSCGVDEPVTPLRRQVARTIRTGALPSLMPMTIFTTDGFHLRVRDGRVLLLWPTPGVPDRPFDDSVDPEWITGVTAKAHQRVPVLRDVPVDVRASWAGLYEMSPDKHAILGAAPGCENFYLVNGSSGHGVMHAPALGQLLAEIILDGRATTIDTTPLRPTRFAERDLNPVSELL
jgi:glycine/D-amino acid oxidase-like deaminating enzyme